MKPLHLLFDDFNARYWGGRLRKPRIRRGALPVNGRWVPRDREIWIDTECPHEDVPGVLLHEMCHVAGVRYHGRRFMAELERLAGLGEPLATKELRLLSDPETRPRSAPRPTRKAVEHEMLGILVQFPYDLSRLTWIRARWLLGHYRFGLFTRTFTRECPWARRMWWRMYRAEVARRAASHSTVIQQDKPDHAGTP